MTDRSASAPFVIALNDPAAADPTRVGPKASALARLAPHHSVPPGFCVTADAYRHARDAGGLDERLAQEIGAAFAGLRANEADAPVAVRSSALDEDGLDASFAGRHETVLGVRTGTGLLDAIVRCWASLDSDDALAYRRERGLPTTGLALPVLAQRLVPADVAGVAFS
ncbi:MAG: PEP/pyruvate-binding domain-containing protein, partial [Trueperaceae bacterium]